MKKLFLVLCFLCSAVSLMASGSISGTVTTALSVPLPGATVTLLQGSSTVIAITTTAANGTYSFSAVAAGDYVVRSSLLTFQTAVAGVAVVDGQNSTANFSLGSNPGAISGQIVDNTSHLPIVGATVGAIQNNILMGSATTNTNGNYTINGLSAGAYVANATASGHQAAVVGSAVLGGQTTTANFSLLVSPGTITGMVTSANGALPISNALIQVSSGGTVVYSALTNGSGNYTITGVAAGSYTVTAIATDYTTSVAGTTVTAGGTTTANFSLQLAPGAVSGVVTSGAMAISGARVEVKLGSVVVGTAVTDNAGGYSIAGVAPGAYVATAYAAGYQTATVGAIVISNSISTANFSLSPDPGTISGTVIAASGGLPIISALVQVTSGGSVVGSALTDSSGNFMIAGIAPGSYSVSAAAATYQTAVRGAVVSSDQTTIVNASLAALPGVISGTVTSVVGSMPIAGALVQVTLDNAVLFSTVTDSLGNYSISGVAPGVYVENISASGYQTGVSGAIVTASTTTTVNVSLQTSPGAITGVVTSASGGMPISGASVQLNLGNVVVGSAVSDNAGKYSISGVMPGAYVVNAYATSHQAGIAGVIVTSANTSIADFSLQSDPGIISGTVTKASGGLPIVSALVQVTDGSSLIASILTDSSGNFTISGVAPGSYTISATAATYQTAVQGAMVSSDQTTSVDFSLAASPGVISGTVISAIGSTPLSGALVQVTLDNAVLFSTVTDSSGDYSISGVAPGVYVATISASGYQTGVSGAIVTASTTTTINVSLQASPGAIAGAVMSESGGSAISGALVEMNLGSVVVGSAVTDNSGGYSISGVTPGVYVVNVYATDYQTGGVGAVVTSNVQSMVDFSLQPNPEIISGIVTKESGGLPIAGALVQVIDGSTVIDTILTDSSGNFAISGVAPGSYTISATAATYQTAVEGAIVSSDQTTSVDFSLAASPGVISGTVISAIGSTPLSGALVQVTLNNAVIFSTVTDNSGDYSISGVAPGVYVVTTSVSGYQTGVSGAIVTASTTTTVNVSLQASPGAIAGAVTSASEAAPISGALVEVNLGNIVVGSALTDNTGGFSISGIAPGSYVVDVYAANYQTGVSGGAIILNSTSTVDFSLQSNPGTIVGTVTSASGGLPIAGALVQIIDGSTVIDAILTDSSGNFTISGVAPGSYTLSVTAAANQTAVTGAIVSSGQTTTVNASLAALPGMISGTVVATAGSTPIAGAVVEVTLDNVVLFSTVTNSSGNYLILGIAAGSYVVRVSANGYQTSVVEAIVVANVTTTVNFSLSASPGTISGTVTSASGGAPISGVLVEANLVNVVVGSAVTDSAGNYSIQTLSPGVYVINAYATGYQTGTVGAIVMANNTTTANLSLVSNPGTITGTVIATSGSSSIVGAAVQFIYNGTVVHSILTDNSGAYSVAGLVPGSYDLTAAATGYSTGVASIDLSAGEMATVDFSLASAPGFISGTVVSTVGSTPIAGALVEVDLNGVLISSTLTNSSGSYSITGLAPNTYAVRAQANSHQAQLNPTVMVSSNAGTTVNFSLQANPGQVQGHVIDAISGQPLPGVFANVFEDGDSIGAAVTDASGNYTFGGLAADNYTLTGSINNYVSVFASFSVSAGGTAIVNLSLIPNFPPTNLTGSVNVNAFFLQADRIHHLQWDTALGGNIANYRIYRNGIYLATISLNGPLEYNDHNRKRNGRNDYTVTAVNTSGNESAPVSISLQEVYRE